MASLLDAIVFVLSVACGVLGLFLLAQRGVRMMRGGLLYTLSIGLAVIGLALAVFSVSRLLGLPPETAQVAMIVVLVTLYFIAYAAWHNAAQLQSEA